MERDTATKADDGDEKMRVTPLVRFLAPIGGQEVELQQVDYVHGGVSLLRVRIREGKRFTIFDIDQLTAARWGDALSRWAGLQAAEQIGTRLANEGATEGATPPSVP